MKRYIIFALLMTAGFVMGLRAQKRNVLRIPDMTVLMGDAQLPVELENTDEVVALQFDLTIPQSVTLQTTATTTERLQGHKVSVSGLGSERYRVLVLSSQNMPLRGQKGVLFYLPIVIPTSFEEGSVHPLSITDATAIKSTGENVLTEVVAGNLCVSPLPDLTVKQISSDKQTLTPGTTFTVSWLVENVGNLQAQGGWSEQLSLVSDDGTQSKVIATTHYDGTLEVGGVVSRQVEIALPRMLGLSDKARVRVQILPDAETGESKSGQANNTQTSDSYVYIDNLLALELSSQYVMENTTSRISMKLTRSGRWNKSETFALTATPEGRINMPSQVTIPAGQSGTVAYLTVNNNDTLDQDSLVNIKVTAEGYDAIEQHLVIKDDEQPTLTLTVLPSVVQEGDTLKLTIATDRIGEDSVVVNLASEYSTRFTLPSKIVIPQGQSEVTVDVIAKDDDLPGLGLSNTFTASAPNHRVGKAIVLLEDDDMPALELTLTPSVVSEGDGVTSVSATLRRTTNTNSKITVKLSDDGGSSLFFPSKTLQLDKGVNEKNFNFGPIDNSTVDGDRTYTITAAVWISSCSCGASGESAGSVSAQLQVLDDDGPALRLSSGASVLNEGKQVVLTISRNTSTDEALTVHLSSDGDERLEYDHDITIPVGQKQQTVTITAIANAEEDDTRNIVFTVQAEGYASSTCWLTLSDKTMADAQILNLNVGTNEVVAGDKVNVAVRVGNTGTASLPAQTKVTFYVDGSATPSVTAYLQEPLQAQSTITIEREVPLPAVVGTHRIQVAVNADRMAQELNYTNNVSSYANVVVLPPFTTTVNIGKQIYAPQEEIIISGTISGKSGGEKEVEVYVINSGYRHSIKVTSDAEGHFSTSYLPYSSQTGHFAVGACYPSENLTEEMASFEILAIKRTSTSAITADFHIDETATGTIGISNPSKIPLTGISVKAVDVPTDCNITLDCPSTIAGQSTANITYSINAGSVSQGNDWQQLRIEVTTAEGPSLTIPFYYYCRNHLGHLVSDITAINTTLNIYSSRDYPFTITNIGKGETGKITLSLPSWMTTMTPASMPSLKQGESAQVVLHLTPSDRMQLNIPVTGQIGVNCESGHGFALPFSIEPVSQTTGTLIIDACDENTYFTDEKPHLQGATVVVTHPATGAVVAQGTTGDDGIFRQELPEGYYKVKVTAEKHDTYQNNIIISPAQDNNITVNLSLQAITVSWTMEETEVDDEYRIENKVDYESNVPVPVVVVTIPSIVNGDDLKPGESLFIPVTMTNKGLIRAENVQLFLPKATEEWELMALSDAGPMTLESGESVNIALQLTRKNSSIHSQRHRAPDDEEPDSTIAPDVLSIMNDCFATVAAFYQWYCGKDIKSNAAFYRISIKACASAQLAYTYLTNSPIVQGLIIYNNYNGSVGDVTIWNAPGGDGNQGSPNGEGGSRFDFTENYASTPIGQGSFFCDPCRVAIAEAVVSTVIGEFNPVVGVCNSIADMAINTNKNGQVDPVDVASVGLNISGLASDVAGIASIAVSIIDLLRTCLQDDNGNNNQGGNPYDYLGTYDFDKFPPFPPIDVDSITSPDLPLPPANWEPWVAWGELRIFNNVARKYYGQLRTTDKVLRQIVVSRAWYENGSEDIIRFFNAMKEQGAEGELRADSLLPYKPEAVSKEWIEYLVERINNTYVGSTATNKINIDSLMVWSQIIQDYDHEAKENGYSTMSEWYAAALNELKQDLGEGSTSVCSSVTLQFSQSLVMTRQAFRGTLTIHNGHDTEAMQDIRLNLIIKDEEGVIATEYEFQTNIESVNGFDSEAMSEGIWTLGAQGNGVVTTLFIPTKYAAPTSPKEWSFGGTLTYIDPFTGLEVTRELTPVTLTVKPTPELDLTYFLQRDIYGDDPLTEDIIEPMEPAEFALVINNKGGSDATNVKLTTRQPQIEKNEKGLAVKFSFVSSQLNGNPAQLLFGESQVNDFGTIPALSQAYAQWWLQSSLLGHFTAYDVEATHVTSYGNENLSLLDKVEVKELIHGFTAGEDGEIQLRGFIVNEIEDLNDAPDTLYFSNATTQTLHTATHAEAIRQSITEYVLRIVPNGNGWNYGSISDPTGGNMTLTKVTDADGTELPLDNVWQTARTMRDGQDWLYETRLHFIANVTAGEIQLHLTFTAEEQRTILDENSLEKPENAVDVNVLVRRTMRGGKWNALCLPFTMTKPQISSAFGEKAQVAKFVSWDSERDADDNVIGIDLFFEPGDTIEANKPCIVKPETDIMEFTADNVDIVVEENPLVTVGETESPAYGAMIGTYWQTEVPENSLLLSEGNLQYSTMGVPLGAFYAYFDIKDVLSNYEDAKDKVRILLIIYDLIHEIPAGELRPDNKMFDLSGRAVMGQLRKGIYVSKGKKIVIR